MRIWGASQANEGEDQGAGTQKLKEIPPPSGRSTFAHEDEDEAKTRLQELSIAYVLVLQVHKYLF